MPVVLPLSLPRGRPTVRMPVDQKFAECFGLQWWAAGHLSIDWPSIAHGSESSVVGVTVGLRSRRYSLDCTAGGDAEHCLVAGRQGSGQCASYVNGDAALTSGVCSKNRWRFSINPYPTAFPYGNGMVLHFYQQQERSTTKTVHKVINKGLKAYV